MVYNFLLVHVYMENVTTKTRMKWRIYTHILYIILENVEHCGGEPEQAGYYGYMHINRLSFTLK